MHSNVPPSAEVMPRRHLFDLKTAAALSAVGGALLGGSSGADAARREGVNKPELLPTGDKVNVIDLAGFLTSGEERRLERLTKEMESATGIKLRILCQDYPQTPGLAIKDYWGVDDKTIVMVVDKSFSGNLLNFNVGGDPDLQLKLPYRFWQRIQNKYGNKYNVEQMGGEDRVILKTATAINYCLRSKDYCVDIPSDSELPKL
ncbi:unnamed protein product [Vitrella brassicaformis CCMP3155]|uniref:TPM domain-containing protein n=1 Tax=Vitrella brassicaformis (strain CCMP3155) TaxID=1169540 RepID=A0A0G4ES39_VITBC|nr:unnamed protein product [Vitrella brassicaformis CCMP3155]|eukprot:CEM00177.1 unnamed protein product [Vitrella brassicaformis CCMP3155]